MKLLLFASTVLSNILVNVRKVFSTKTTLKTLTMILTICNTPPSIDHLQLRNVLVKNNDSVKNLMNQCSNGTLNFEPVIFPSYVNIPCPESVMSCDTDFWAYRADNAILPYFPTLNEYTYKLYVLPKGGCAFAGLGQVGPCNKNVTCRVWISGDYVFYPTTYFHELGHNLGLEHASYQGNPYGDYSDIMGYCCMKRCFNAPNLHKLRIKSPLYDFTIPLDKKLQQTFLLKANDYLLIREPRKTPTVNWYIQWRIPVNEEIPNSFAPSVNIYYIYASENPLAKKTYLQAMLRNQGETWSEESLAFTITLVFISPLEVGIEIK